jgi:hypothetical protein
MTSPLEGLNKKTKILIKQKKLKKITEKIES